MSKKPLFAGLVIDEFDRPAETALVGNEYCYVVDDDGFRRHISSEKIDRQVLEKMGELIKGNEDLLGEQTAKMMGEDDIFSRAMIQQQLENIEGQFEKIMESGIPEEGRSYMGMMGFKIIINMHGDVIRLDQPSGLPEDE
ncbi:MAG: hypothetical protein HN392_11515 [Anaerolineae bacterium]|jgi:hypothetical protein|nr:hypothetical protein [Anaerolineae bacterium]MBT7075618.1 hypothetical protein [Anaerolineae bacterium]MBT7782547.1 hypothetical protein [Anaerolineae bacterium]